MPPFIHPCPIIGTRVQGFAAEDIRRIQRVREPVPSRRAGQFIMRIRPARMWDKAPKEEASQISIDPAPARIPAAGLRYVAICLHMKGSAGPSSQRGPLSKYCNLSWLDMPGDQ